MDDGRTFDVPSEELTVIRHAIMETIQFFEGMSVGISVTTAADLRNRLKQLRAALKMLEPAP